MTNINTWWGHERALYHALIIGYTVYRQHEQRLKLFQNPDHHQNYLGLPL